MPEAAQTKTQALIAALWQRNQPQVLERLALLDTAAQTAFDGTITPEQREEAASIAHKLAGSLGMFGFHEGTRIARELELLLESSAPEPLTPLTQALRESLFPTAG